LAGIDSVGDPGEMAFSGNGKDAFELAQFRLWLL